MTRKQTEMVARAMRYPVPTEPTPSLEQLEDWAIFDGDCESTDGCRVDPDGSCEHGHPSWLRRLGLV
jgi:hypothetical protein